MNHTHKQLTRLESPTWSGSGMHIRQSTAPCTTLRVWQLWSGRDGGDPACSSPGTTASPGCSEQNQVGTRTQLKKDWQCSLKCLDSIWLNVSLRGPGLSDIPVQNKGAASTLSPHHHYCVAICISRPKWWTPDEKHVAGKEFQKPTNRNTVFFPQQFCTEAKLKHQTTLDLLLHYFYWRSAPLQSWILSFWFTL